MFNVKFSIISSTTTSYQWPHKTIDLIVPKDIRSTRNIKYIYKENGQSRTISR